jgi:hypothetical protein
MDADEKEICNFLKSWPGQYVGLKEIARRAGGKWRYREDPNWPLPVLTRLIEGGQIESDSNAHYRLRPQGKRAKEKRWMSPHIKRILEKAGKEFTEGIDIDTPDANEPPPAGNKTEPPK